MTAGQGKAYNETQRILSKDVSGSLYFAVALANSQIVLKCFQKIPGQDFLCGV